MKPVLSACGFVALAGIAGALISTTRWLTADRITANTVAREQAIVSDLLGSSAGPAALGRLCRSSVRGYAGNIDLLVLPEKPAEEANGATTIAAVRVLQHRETPGIGDFISTDNSPWILGFTGLSLAQTPRDTQQLWAQQLDAVSGATITRRAMIKGVAHACEPRH